MLSDFIGGVAKKNAYDNYYGNRALIGAVLEQAFVDIVTQVCDTSAAQFFVY